MGNETFRKGAAPSGRGRDAPGYPTPTGHTHPPVEE